MRWLIALTLAAFTATAQAHEDFDLTNAELDVQAREADYSAALTQVKAAEVEADYNEKRYERIRKLAKTGAVGEEDVAKAETEFLLAKLKVDLRKALANRARLELRRAKLKVDAIRASQEKPAAPGKRQSPKPKKAPPNVKEFPATVTEVIDGDTVKIKMPSGKTDSVRFALCDTPEKGQPHGDAAKKFVEDACLNKTITIRTTGDRDTTQSERLIAEIILPNGKNLNRELVRLGHAWWFYHYSKDQSVGALEAEAKALRRGLFSSATPIYPRNWRRGARVGSISKSAGVFIMALLPNPAGDEGGNEAVILANGTAKDASIDKWRITDDDGWSIRLCGVIPAGSTRTIKQLSQKPVLGNRHDVVRLIDHESIVVQTVAYENAREGSFVLVPQ